MKCFKKQKLKKVGINHVFSSFNCIVESGGDLLSSRDFSKCFPKVLLSSPFFSK